MRIVQMSEAEYGDLTGDPYYNEDWSQVLVVMDDHTDEVLDTLWFDSFAVDCPEDMTIGRSIGGLLSQLGHTIETYTS